jgi:hypothetical protein
MASTGPASQSSSLSQSTGSGPLARVGLDGSLGQNVALADARRSILQQFGAKKDGYMVLGQVSWTLVSDSYGKHGTKCFRNFVNIAMVIQFGSNMLVTL